MSFVNQDEIHDKYPLRLLIFQTIFNQFVKGKKKKKILKYFLGNWFLLFFLYLTNLITMKWTFLLLNIILLLKPARAQKVNIHEIRNYPAFYRVKLALISNIWFQLHEWESGKKNFPLRIKGSEWFMVIYWLHSEDCRRFHWI